MIHRFGTVESTNTLAKEMAREGAPHGTVILADHQTAGRGRMGRHFDSPAGQGIYMSLILRPACPPTALMHLTCAVAVGVCDAVEQTLGFRPQIKWINDLIVRGKKLAGILTELSVNPQTGLVDYAIVGVGLNCNQREFPPELQDIACSAAMVTGKPVDREALTQGMISRLLNMDLTSKKEIMAQYGQDCLTLGRDVVLSADDRPCRAVALDEDGGLIVEYPDGQRRTVNCGEVSIRGLGGYV